MRRLPSLLSALAMVVLVLSGAPALAQNTQSPPQYIFDATIPELNLSKFPDIAAAGQTVHIATNDNRRSAVYLAKPDSSRTFPNLETFGEAPGQADFSPVSIAAEEDGTIHVAWINQNTRQLLYRNRPPGGSFGPQRTITTSGGFPANINIGVASDGAIFVAWRIADAAHRVVRSTDDGANWSPPIQLGDSNGINFPYVATGPSGQVAILFTAASGDNLQVFAAIWTGSGYNILQVSASGANFADPSGAYDLDGNLYVAYRGIPGESSSGVWLATRQGNGGFQVNRLANPSVVFDIPNVQTDVQGNVHVAWIATAGGPQQVFYAFRPRGGTFSNAVAAPNPGGALFNPRLAVNISDRAYAHVVAEFFQGDGTTTTVRYFLFEAGPGSGGGSAQPVIEDGEEITEREPAVRVSFENVNGEPTQLRWRWGAAPDDSTSDSGGWRPFANPTNIAVPASILDSATCTPVTLYTQVRNAENQVSLPASDTIIFDTRISGQALAINPFSRARERIFTPVATTAGLTVTLGLADVGTEGANDGDPRYTRVPAAYVLVQDTGDCSGLRAFSTGRSQTSYGRAVSITNQLFANVLGYPGVMAVGPNQLTLRVIDQVGNFTDVAQTLIYDPVKPALTASTNDSLTAVANPVATVLARLDVKNVTVADAGYGNRGFWGVWVANSRAPVANPATDLNLRWVPIEAPGSTNTFSINNWSVATGLDPSQVSEGSYVIYMRFLDGAGNPTDGVISTTLQIDDLTFVRNYLPLVDK